MSFNINVTLSADPQLLNALQNLFSGMPGAQKATRGRPAKDPSLNGSATEITATAAEDFGTQAEAEVTEVTEPQKPVQAATTTTATPAVTIEQVRESVKKASEAGKRDGIKAILAEFGADKVTSLQPTQYSDFLQKIEAL